MKRHTTLRVAVTVAVCLWITPAFAQNAPPWDVSGGYAFLRDDDIDQNLHGWLVSVTGYPAAVLGLTGEVGGSRASAEVLGTTLRTNYYSFVAGPRLSTPRSRNVVLFGQVLVGMLRSTVGILDQTESRRNLTWQPGGGADFRLTPKLSLRVGGDYRRVVLDGDTTTQLRFFAGAAIGGS